MVLGCLERIHQLAQKSPHKEGTLQQTKSQKTEGERLFFLLKMNCCLFRVGAGHQVGRMDEGGTDGKKGEREG